MLHIFISSTASNLWKTKVQISNNLSFARHVFAFYNIAISYMNWEWKIVEANSALRTKAKHHLPYVDQFSCQINFLPPSGRPNICTDWNLTLVGIWYRPKFDPGWNLIPAEIWYRPEFDTGWNLILASQIIK